MEKEFEHWIEIAVPRTNLYNWNLFNDNFGNDTHYIELKNWCKQHFPENEWHSEVMLNGVKRFKFKEPKYVTMFRLKWNY